MNRFGLRAAVRTLRLGLLLAVLRGFTQDSRAQAAVPSGVGPPTAAEHVGHAELRIYNVTSNRMDAVLERFRDTVDPVRQRHGIRALGYWSAAGTTNGGTFIYLLEAPSRAELERKETEFGADPDFRKGYAASSQKHGKTVDGIQSLALVPDPALGPGPAPADTGSPPRAFDLRIYTLMPGKLDAFRARWRDHATRIHGRHGLTPLGGWKVVDGSTNAPERLVVLLAGADPAAIRAAITAFHADPEWRRIEQETEKDGKLRSGVTSWILAPADFSALR